ncbi:MAG: hypothetical protein KatS3mg040_0829 [Candidatus Kapaibacterium sp.]|nr:MAG: hypothetical protein KatS3mg040_0829 [Candidatus Kapabacteria bacterium]
MRWVALVIGAALLGSCSSPEERWYRLQVECAEVPDATGLRVPAYSQSGALLGYNEDRHAIVQRSKQGEQVLLELRDSVLDVTWDGEHYILALQVGDSIRILHFERNRTLRLRCQCVGHGGRFLPADRSARWAWLSSDGQIVVHYGDEKIAAEPGRIIVRDGAKLFYATSDTTLVVLDGGGDRLPDIVVWEGIAVNSGQKRFSGVVPAKLDHVAATAHVAAAIVRAGESYAIEWYRPTAQGDVVFEAQTLLPQRLLEPKGMLLSGDTAVAVFGSGVAVATERSVLAVSTSTGALRLRGVQSAVQQDGRILISDGSRAIVLAFGTNPWWWVERSVPILYRIALALIGIVVFVGIVSRIGRYRRLVGALLEKGSRGALIVVDRHGRVRRLNSVARLWLGIERGTPLGRPLAQYLRQHWVPLGEIIEQSLSLRSGIVREVAITSDGTEQRFIVTAEPLYGLFTRFEGLLLSLWDVTPQYQQWQLLNWAQLAHDLQTSVTTIRLDAEQLASVVMPNGRQLQQRILRQATTLLQRFRDLLALGRGEEAALEEYAVAELFAEVVSDLEAVVPAQISLVIRPTPLVVRLDRRRILRALHNAVTNAIRAIGSREGIVELSATLAAESIILAVRDTGVGMDEETCRKMQQPLFTTHRAGHGLGSVIMQQMVRAHGGWIEVRSRLGEGTTVMFHLPRSLYVRHQR